MSKVVSDYDLAKKFIRKYCRLYGQGISFSSDDSSFHSWVEIESKSNIEEVEWCEHNFHFSFRIPVQLATSISDGKIVNDLDAELFASLMLSSIEEMKEVSKYRAADFNTFLSHLNISEGDCVSIFNELYLDKAKSMMDKSFPVAQRAYDRWLAKGNKVQAKRERVASVFGSDFISSLEEKIASFKDTYIKNKKAGLLFAYKMMESIRKSSVYTDEQLEARAEKEAQEEWPYWVKYEVESILDILLRYDIGVCQSSSLQIDKQKLKIEGSITGSKNNLSFYTIFAGGYNIQRLHMRTLVRD